MNILLFPRILAKTGVGNHVKLLSEELVEQGHNVTIVSATSELTLDDRVKFVRLPADSSNPITTARLIRQLHNIIVSNNIQIVHCHHRKSALIMKLYNVFYKIPFVYTLHATNIPSDFLHRKLTFVGDCAISISDSTRQVLVNDLKIPADKIVSIPNGVRVIAPLTGEQIEKQKKAWNIPSGKYVIALHSRIDSIKNHSLIVDAIAKLSDKARDRIVVVCSGQKHGDYYSQLVEKISHLGLSDKFIFVGWCDSVNILSISDFLFLPSIREGFPLSVPEAFLFRIPVARTRVGGFDEQKYCLPIDPYDPQPIIDIIESLVENGKEQYADRTQAAYELAMNEFTVEVMTARNVKLYEEVCSK